MSCLRAPGRRAWTAALLALTVTPLVTACTPAPVTGVATYVRDTDDPTLDDPAMSTGLDRRDLERVFDREIRDFLGSPFHAEVVRRGAGAPASRPTIAIVPFLNQTSEHIDTQLDALLSKFEATLVGARTLRVVSLENHPELVAQIEAEQSPLFDRQSAARVGRLLGVDYILTGKVFDRAERTSDARRVQYFLFMQAIGVEDGVVVWQGESGLTKALVAVR